MKELFAAGLVIEAGKTPAEAALRGGRTRRVGPLKWLGGASGLVGGAFGCEPSRNGVYPCWRPTAEMSTWRHGLPCFLARTAVRREPPDILP